MRKVNIGKGFIEVREVKQTSSKSVSKRETFTTIERTIWDVDGELYIKYKGDDLRVYLFKGETNYYWART